MRSTPDSWFNRARNAAVVVGSLCIAEAGTVAGGPPPPPLPAEANTAPAEGAPKLEEAASDPPPPPLPENVKPGPFDHIKDGFLKKILPILQNTRVHDDKKRLQALRELEGALKPRENCKLMTETRIQLIAELTINTLEEALNAGNERRKKEAVQELFDTWLHDNNFYVRSRVARILNREFANNRDEDPRYRPPDISDLTSSIHQIGIVRSVNEWEKHEGIQYLLKNIQREVHQFTKSDYNARKLASKRLRMLVTELRQIINPLPSVILDSLKPDIQKRSIDLETYKRLERLYEFAISPGTQAYVLPQMEARASSVIEDVQNVMGGKVRLDSSYMMSLGLVSLSLRENNRTYSSIITQLCQKTNTYPVADGHPHNLILKPHDQKESRKTVIALDGMIAVITPGEKGKPDIIDLLPDPSYTFVQIDAATGEGLQTKDATVRIGEKPNWKLNTGGAPTKKSITTKSDTLDTNDKNPKPGKLTIEAWIASHQYTQEVRLKDGAASFHDNGPHDFDITTTLDSDTKGITAHVRIGAYEQHIPWPNTPYTSDALTWEMADNIVIQFFDANGKEIGSTQGQIQINQRAVSMDCTLSTQPASVKVTSPRHINKQRREIPLDGGPSKNTVLKPFFEARP